VNRYSLTHVPDPALLHELRSLLARERVTTAELLAHLAEVDARKLYAAAGYPSMFAYCVEELRLSEDVAYKRIQAARTARRFPVIFSAVADGRLNLSGVVLLAPHLGEANADEMLAAAAGRTRAGIEEWLTRRFPRSESLPFVTQLPAVQGPDDQLAPGRVKLDGAELTPGRVAAFGTPARLTPVAPERYSLQLTIGKGTHDKLRHAQALLGHAVPSGEVAEVLDRALDALIGQLERRKFAATSRPRPPQKRTGSNPRHVPAKVRRAVWERDGGRCTFVSTAGHRCEARTRIELDHIEPVARGGTATVNGMRLRCRAHNQYAAECAFGAGFMNRKREVAERASDEARSRAAAAEESRTRAAAAEEARSRAAAAAEEARIRAAATAEVVPWLRALGLRAHEARRAAARCETIPDAPLETRVRCALTGLARPARGHASAIPRPAS
jgi:5-methylcytosine-specific restriction endonuclease McrA